MKIEIDLNNILADEYGPSETLEESIRRQVIDKITEDLTKGIRKKIDEETTRVMNEELQKAIRERMDEIVGDVMNAEYTPVSSYGCRGEPTTFRAELVKSIAAHMEYKPRNYSSEENAFTRGVKGVVEEQIKAFKAEFTAKIDADFKRDALAFAVKTLSEKLGLSK